MPMLRPMLLAFPGDAECGGDAAEAQFMLGPTWLTRPVTEPDAASAAVCLPILPNGFLWRYYFNGSEYKGGRWVTVATPLTEFPLFERVDVLLAESSGRGVVGEGRGAAGGGGGGHALIAGAGEGKATAFVAEAR